MAFMFNDDKTKLTVGSQGILLAAYNTQSYYFEDPDYDPATASNIVTASVAARDQTKNPVIYDVRVDADSSYYTMTNSSVARSGDNYVWTAKITATSGNSFTLGPKGIMVLIQEV